MTISAPRFGAILHPAKKDSKTGHPDRGPVRKSWQSNSVHVSSLDIFQWQSAQRYLSALQNEQPNVPALVGEDQGERRYVLTHQHAQELKDQWDSEPSLQRLNQDITALNRQLDELIAEQKAQKQALTQHFLDTHTKEIQDVLYVYSDKAASASLPENLRTPQPQHDRAGAKKPWYKRLFGG